MIHMETKILNSRKEVMDAFHQCNTDGKCKGCPYYEYPRAECKNIMNGEIMHYLSNDEQEHKDIIDSIEQAYNGGLKDAWDMANKIAFVDKDGGFSCKEFNEIFFGKNKGEVFEMNPSDVARMIRSWEKSKTFNDGDIVIHNDSFAVGFPKGIVTYVENDNIHVLWETCNCGVYNKKELKNTGEKRDMGDIHRTIFRLDKK